MRLAIAVATGMDFMHRRSWIHRDIRAVNVFLTSANPLDWVAKLGDLGLARDLRKLRATKRQYPINHVSLSSSLHSIHLKPGPESQHTKSF